MIELKSDRLVVSFPEVHPDAILTVEFQRTLRIPDDGRDYPLPPGLGRFPLSHIDDHSGAIPAVWLKRGGVLLPMYQSEALWLRFTGHPVASRQTDYPFAVKVATGKISAITGEPWQNGLSRNPQNYLVTPTQPWLDGYCVEKGLIRQFVAMPLGDGYSVEEQMTGKAEFGGIQFEFFPMQRTMLEKRFPVVLARTQQMFAAGICSGQAAPGAMGLAPGGRMRQEIYQDPWSIHDWDTRHASRCFVHLVNSVHWRRFTGHAAPATPVTAQHYSRAGLPWFDYYDADAKALRGSEVLSNLQSVGTIMDKDQGPSLPNNETVETPSIINLAPRSRSQVREAAFD